MAVQGEILGEVGLASNVDANEQVITFRDEYCYTDPVVVAKPISYNDPSPAVVRIWDVTRTNFKIRIQNFIYESEFGTETDDHSAENVGYLVMEKGHHVIQTGSIAEAGLVNIGRTDAGADPFITVNFLEPFPSEATPVVLTSCNSRNEDEAVITRIKDVTNTGFKLALQEKEASDQNHAVEEVAYIAIIPKADGVIGLGPAGVPSEIGRHPSQVTEEWDALFFIRSFGIPDFPPFSSPPIIIADMQTTEPEASPEPAELRVRTVTTASMELSAVEELSLDAEILHPPETVGYAAFETPEFILGNALLLIFLIDESGSVGEMPFRNIAVGVANAIEILPTNGSVSVLVLKFGSDVTTIPPTGPTAITSEAVRTDVSDQVRTTPYGGGLTFTLTAIETMVNWVTLTEDAGTAFRHKIALIITDGDPSDGSVDEVVEAAEEAWLDAGIQINAVGFGGSGITVDFLDRVVQPNPGSFPCSSPMLSCPCAGFTPSPFPPEGSFWCVAELVSDIPNLIDDLIPPLLTSGGDALQVEYGPAEPVITDGTLLSFGTPKFPVGQIRLTAQNEDASNINSITFETRQPTEDPLTYPFSWAYLYHDRNSNGKIDPGDPQIGHRVPVAPVTKFTFDNLDLTLTPDSPKDLLLCYDVTCITPNAKKAHWKLTDIVGGQCFSWNEVNLERTVDGLVPVFIDEDIVVSLPNGLEAEFGSILPTIDVLIKTKEPMDTLGILAVGFRIDFNPDVLIMETPSIINTVSEEAGWFLPDFDDVEGEKTIILYHKGLINPLKTCGLLVSIPFAIKPGVPGSTITANLNFILGPFVIPVGVAASVDGTIDITYP